MSDNQKIIIPCKKEGSMGLTCIHSLVGDIRNDNTEIWCSKFEEYGMGITKYGCDPK
jgi:hypothetical protein